MSGVGPAALEMGLIAAKGDVTEVRIRAVNTGARILARVQTPGGTVTYDGDTSIDGVPGTAAPVRTQLHGCRRFHHRGIPADGEPDGQDRRD